MHIIFFTMKNSYIVSLAFKFVNFFGYKLQRWVWTLFPMEKKHVKIKFWKIKQNFKLYPTQATYKDGSQGIYSKTNPYT
jgi:hypothetical protein